MNKRLLLSGMGCFLCFGSYSALNVIALPFAREYYGYGAAPMLLSLAAALLLFFLVSRKIAHTSDEMLRNALRITQPTYIATLLLVQIIFGMLTRYTPSGDNFMLFNGSMMLADEGSFASNPDFGLYLARFSNQWGFLLILTGLRRLFTLVGLSDFFIPLVVLQALLYSGMTAALLDCAEMLRGPRARARLLVLMALCLPLLLAAGVLYTDTYSAPFVVFTLWAALHVLHSDTFPHRVGWALLCGMFAFVGSQIKMTVLIVLLAAAIVWMLSLRLRESACCVLLSFTLALGGTSLVHRAMLAGPIDPAVYAQENTPAIHWVMMSIPTADNPYGSATGDYGITWGMMDEGASHEAVMDSIYTRMKDRIYTLRYPDRFLTAMARKNACAMGDGTFGMTEMLDDRPARHTFLSEIALDGGRYYSLYSAICTGVFMADLLLALFSCLQAIRWKDTRAALPFIAMFGMLLFMMLWEARGRYVFCFIPVLLLLAALAAPCKFYRL